MPISYPEIIAEIRNLDEQTKYGNSTKEMEDLYRIFLQSKIEAEGQEFYMDRENPRRGEVPNVVTDFIGSKAFLEAQETFNKQQHQIAAQYLVKYDALLEKLKEDHPDSVDMINELGGDLRPQSSEANPLKLIGSERHHLQILASKARTIEVDLAVGVAVDFINTNSAAFPVLDKIYDEVVEKIKKSLKKHDGYSPLYTTIDTICSSDSVDPNTRKNFVKHLALVKQQSSSQNVEKLNAKLDPLSIQLTSHKKTLHDSEERLKAFDTMIDKAQSAQIASHKSKIKTGFFAAIFNRKSNKKHKAAIKILKTNRLAVLDPKDTKKYAELCTEKRDATTDVEATQNAITKIGRASCRERV